MTKRITLLGSTGSIGTQSLEVARAQGYKVTGLAAGRNIDLLEAQIAEFRPACVAVADPAACRALQGRLAGMPGAPRVLEGPGGVVELARDEGADVVLNAVVGIAGLGATLAALESGHDVALANKESLVTGGHLVTEACKKHGTRLLPVDSEHSAIFQCLQDAHSAKTLTKILLTASGGPFFGLKREELAHKTPADALKHPNWSMGAKITIDSATMMNKGLEIIEAHHLYGLPSARIGVLVHPQSQVHSLVEFTDGSLMAHMGTPDMRMPIAYCLAWPRCLNVGIPQLNLAMSCTLTFEEPDLLSFPCLDIARQTLGKGSQFAVTLNAANEVAVEAFLAGRIGFMDIPDLVSRALDACTANPPASLEEIEQLDQETRRNVGLRIEQR